MARIIDEFPVEWRRRRYPWWEWLDGKPRVLTQGEDFTVSLVAMQRHFVRTAKERGLQGHTRIISPTEIAVQAVARASQESAGTPTEGPLPGETAVPDEPAAGDQAELAPEVAGEAATGYEPGLEPA
jgi:hypothetical protein